MAKRLVAVIFLLIVLGSLCACEKKEPPDDEGAVGGIYWVSELLDDESYGEYMDGDGELFKKLADYRRRLSESAEFSFYAYANNFVELIGDVPDTCLVNSGTEYEAQSRYDIDGERVSAAEAIQVSENFFGLFPMELKEGRCFEDADFDYGETGVIPVLLGSAYRDVFAPGDTFEGYYICERRQFKVIGFIGSGEFYVRSDMRMHGYDNYIVMPFDRAAEDSYFSRAVLLQQICGFVVPKGGRGDAEKELRGYLKTSGLEDWSDMIVMNKKACAVK